VNYIAVFAYAFPHRKTQDFLTRMVDSGCHEICVIAAPWKDLGAKPHAPITRANLSHAIELRPTKDVCINLGIDYFCVEHANEKEISHLNKKYGFNCGLIAGARIIPQKIIDIFADGIINFHPGKLPETSGLDAFFYSIKKNILWGVTAHFIDARVDAGKEIFFQPLLLDAHDTPETAHEKNHQLQLSVLEKVVTSLQNAETLKTMAIVRPQKNPPMTESEKQKYLNLFPTWVSSTCKKV